MSDGSGSSGNDLRRHDASRQYQTLVTAVGGGVFELDADRDFRSVSESTVEMTGYSRERLFGAHVSLLFDDVDCASVDRELRRLREGDSDDATALDVTVRTADGDRIPCELRCSPHPDGPGAVGILREDEERAATAAESRRGDQPPSHLLDNVPGMMYRCRNDPDWPMEFVSDGSRELAGYDPEALERGAVMWGEDVIVEEDRQTVWEAVQAVDEDEETFKITYRIETDDGERRWVEDHGRGVFDDGALVAVEGVITDVTERKTLESELEEVFGRVTDAFYALDEEYRFTHVNERAEELLQRSEAELLGESLWEVFPEATEEDDVRESFRTAIEDQKPTSYELYFEPLDFWVEANLYPSETGVSVYFRDVTERKERERQLEESERRYRALVENIPNGAVALVDEDLRYITVGGSPVDSPDVTADDLQGSRVREAISPELADVLAPRYRAALDGESSTFEHEQDGRHSLIRTFPVRDADGEVFAAMGMSQDITERKERERALEESERRYETILENFPNGAVGLFDEDLRYTVAGGELFDDPEYPLEELTGTRVQERYPDDVLSVIEPNFRAALEGESNEFEIEVNDRELLVYTLPVEDSEGEVFAGMVMAQDITEQKERERYFRDAKAQLEAATEAGAVGTWEWHIPEDRFVAGASLARTFGVDPDRAREGVPLEALVSSIHEADRERIEAEIEAAVESCGEYEAEYRVWNADEELRWVVARGHVECDDDGNAVTFPGAITDITERKRAEQEIENQQKQLETLFDVLPVGVVVAEADGRLVEANEVANGLWGGEIFDAESVADYERYTGWWADTGEPVAPDEWTMARVLRGEEVTDPDVYEIETVDGERRTIMVEGMPILDESGEVSRGVVTMTDVTERREYQRKLTESERQYRTLAENFPNGGVGMYDRDLRYTLVDGTMWDDIEPDAEDLEGKTIREALPPDTADDVEPIFRAALDGETGTVVSTLGGRTYRVWATPLRDADGNITGGQSIALDITEQVEREEKLEELIDRLEASNERLEQFAYAASHDLQEPLRMVSSYLQLIENRYADALDEDGREFIEFAVDGAERMREMIDGLLAYSRVETEGDPFEPVDLNDVLADVRKDLQMKIEETDTEITTESLPRVRGDDAQLQQVFQNLLGNAIEYTEAGPPEVHVSARERDEHCVVSVRDEGVGIDPDDADRIFEVFERLHSRDEHSGTGIGLALCQRIVERHGGTIWVDSAPGEGATFSFTLPIAGDTDE